MFVHFFLINIKDDASFEFVYNDKDFYKEFKNNYNDYDDDYDYDDDKK